MTTTVNERRTPVATDEVLRWNPNWSSADRQMVRAVLATVRPRIAGMHTTPTGAYVRVYDEDDNILLYIGKGYVSGPIGEGWFWPLSTYRPRRVAVEN